MISDCQGIDFVRIIYIPTTFNNPLKVYIKSLKEIYYYNPNTPDTNCKSIFLIEKPGFNKFLKIIGVQI